MTIDITEISDDLIEKWQALIDEAKTKPNPNTNPSGLDRHGLTMDEFLKFCAFMEENEYAWIDGSTPHKDLKGPFLKYNSSAFAINLLELKQKKLAEKKKQEELHETTIKSNRAAVTMSKIEFVNLILSILSMIISVVAFIKSCH